MSIEAMCAIKLTLLIIVAYLYSGNKFMVYGRVTVSSPVNIAVQNGSSAVFNCSSSDGSAGVGWRHNVSGTWETIVAVCNVRPGYESQYSVLKTTGPGRCDLIVNSTTSELTGRYQCSDIDNAEMAYLTSIDSMVSGSQNITNGVIGEQLTASCRYAFSGSNDIFPKFQWMYGTGLPVNNPREEFIGSEFVSSVDVALSSTNVPQYTCSLHYPNGVIQTSDNWIKEWSSKSFDTDYCVHNVHIAGADNGAPDVPINTELTCSGDGHPQPQIFLWTYVIGGTLNGSSSGETFTVNTTDSHRLVCSATNFITYSNNSTVSCTNSTEIRFNLLDRLSDPVPSPQCDCCPDDPECFYPVVICSIIGGCAIIGGGIAFGVYKYKKRD